jgi:hypothetical protein
LLWWLAFSCGIGGLVLLKEVAMDYFPAHKKLFVFVLIFACGAKLFCGEMIPLWRVDQAVRDMAKSYLKNKGVTVGLFPPAGYYEKICEISASVRGKATREGWRNVNGDVILEMVRTKFKEFFVFLFELDHTVYNVVEDLAKEKGMSLSSIPASMQNEYNRKMNSLLESLRRSIRWGGVDYTTMEKLQRQVRLELEWFFDRVKREQTQPLNWGSFFSSLFSGENQQNQQVPVDMPRPSSPSPKYSPPKQEKPMTEIPKIYNPPTTNEICVVCQCNYESGEKAGIFVCGHACHKDCAYEWLESDYKNNGKKTCPICRKDVHVAKILDVPFSSRESSPNPAIPGTSFASGNYSNLSTNQDSAADEECAICLCDLSGFGNVATVSCKGKHRFHKDCINQWLRTDKSCPLCRQKDVTAF